MFLVGDPYKPSFATVTVRGPHPKYITVSAVSVAKVNSKQID